MTSLALLLLLAAPSDSASDAPPNDARPNIVLILADDCTKADLGCYGGQALTPHLDAVQQQGLTFTNCYQAAPMCSPTRHSLYTGLYPVKSGAHPNHTFVKPGVVSIATDLQAKGYRTALSGKRHISPVDAFPFEYSGKDNNPDMAAIDTLMSECATHATPLLLVACSNEPHLPHDKGDASAYDPAALTLPPTWLDTPATREQYARYLAEITYFDGQVGQLLAMLDKHALADNTLVMVLSEQGSTFPFAKWTCYHAGLGSGLIARWPGHIAPGSRTEAMVEYVDVVPTLHEVVDITPERPAGLELDGRSFLPVLRGEADEHKFTVYGIQTTRGINYGADHYGIRSVQSGTLRLIHNLTPETSFRCVTWKDPYFVGWLEAEEASDSDAAAVLDRFRSRPEWELYDLATDPHEQTNLYGREEYAGETATLKRRLADWMTQQGDAGQPTEMNALQRMTTKRKKRMKK